MNTDFNPYKLLLEKDEVSNSDILRATISVYKELQALKSNYQVSIQKNEPHKIPEPNGDDGKYKLDGNAAGEVMKYIEGHNRDSNQKLKYIEFPKGSTSNQINRSCKTILHDLMIEHIGPNYYAHTWQSAYNGPLRAKCKLVIRKASEMKEFEVLRQAFGHWAIIWQASQKMKSGKKKVKLETKVESKSEERGSMITNLAKEQNHSNVCKKDIDGLKKLNSCRKSANICKNVKKSKSSKTMPARKVVSKKNVKKNVILIKLRIRAASATSNCLAEKN